MLLAAATAGCWLLLSAVAVAACCCFLLLLDAAAGCCCCCWMLLLLLAAVALAACCCCLLVLLAAAAATACCLMLLLLLLLFVAADACCSCCCCCCCSSLLLLAVAACFCCLLLPLRLSPIVHTNFHFSGKMSDCLNILSPKTLATAVVEKLHQGFSMYPGLLNSACVANLLQEAQGIADQEWSDIFNKNRKRSVAAAGPVGRQVALLVHRYLTEEACILDDNRHAVELIQCDSKTASFLRSQAGCKEQVPHSDFSPWHCSMKPRSKPLSCIIFLQHVTESSGSRIKFWKIDEEGKLAFEIVKGNPGDLLVFEGNFI
jgi:hypothetical protein